VVSGTDGLAIIAVRTTSVDSLGHVGVGFQNNDGTWTIGAIENTGGSPVVSPGADNGAWVEKDKTISEVEEKFHSLNYDGFKIIQASDTKPDLADAEINKFPTRGYDVVTNNCLSATIDLLTAYGVKSLPLQIAHVAPNDYYAKVNGEEFLWDLVKKTYTDINTGMPLADDSNAHQEEQQVSTNSVLGEWTLSFDWGCTGSPSQAVIYFDDDGTFRVIDKSGPGKWTQTGNTITWQYDQGKHAIYEGTLDRSHMEGTMSNDASETGCWSADKRYYGNTENLA
jgi:hypothetical protein